MALDKFKICPSCGEHNVSSRFECLKCETDLTGVKIVDEAILQSNQNTHTDISDSTSGESAELVKLCDCGTSNPPQARKCSFCSEDISDIRPAPRQKAVAPKRYAIHSIDSKYSFAFETTVTVIGRDAMMRDYLSEKSYVSRQHAKFTVTDGGVFIENISMTNHTFINNTPISNGMLTLLKDGDEIGVGGKVMNGNRQTDAAYFVFKVRA